MEPIQSLIPAALARVVRPAPLSPEKVLFAWRVSVGPAVSRVTRVSLAGRGVLEAVVGDDRFGDELERSAPMVLSRIQGLLGAETVGRLELKRPGKRAAQRRRRGSGPVIGKAKGER